MGCNSSSDNSSVVQLHPHQHLYLPAKPSSLCWKEENITKTVTTFNFNETEVDLTHFSKGYHALGVGGFGLVRRVRKCTGTDKDVDYAMKSMSKEAILKRTSGPSAVITELKCLILLSNCRYICQIHYAFQSPSHLFMILELARGGDLRCCLRSTTQSKFSETTAKLLICQILLALEHCHRLKILHRDVKPENILVTKAGEVKLSDFGVAKILPDVEDCRSTSGTHGYMAPEVYMGAHVHGTVSEWFATGVTLHELLTGRRPFEASRLQAFRSCREFPQHGLQLDSLKPFTSKGKPPRGTQCDQLWPEYLYSHACDQLSDECKDFVRTLLFPDPMVRLGGSWRQELGLKTTQIGKSNIAASSPGFLELQRHPWLCNFSWQVLFTGDIHNVSNYDKIAEEFPGLQEYHSDPNPAATSPDFPHADVSSLLHSDRLQRMDRKQSDGGEVCVSGVSLGMGNRDELQKALQQHLQAPDISASQQAIFQYYEYHTRLPNLNPIGQEQCTDNIIGTSDKSQAVIHILPLPKPHLMVRSERRERIVNEEWKQDDIWHGQEKHPYEIMSPL